MQATAADFGRREHAAQDAADDDEDRDQSPERLAGDLDRLAERDDLALGEVVAPRDVEAQDHQRQAEHQARDDAGDEQVRDRDRAAGRERIDHRVVRGRDQQRLQRARDGDVDGEQPRIAGLDHLRDHHRADRRGVGDRRAGDAAEHRRGEDVHQRQPAADEADEHLGEVDQARRHAAFGHDAAGEDEERDREQREIVHAVGGLEHDGFERQVDPQRREDRGKPERIGDRHAEQAQHAEAADQDEHVHGGYSVLICEMASSVGLLEQLRGPQPLDDEQRRDQPADRHRQVGRADRIPGEIGDRLVPGGLAQLDAPPEHEQVGAHHAGFDQPADRGLAPCPPASSG